MPNFLIDDRCIIPEDIKRMSKEELEMEIKRLEKEIALKKAKRLQDNNNQMNKAV